MYCGDVKMILYLLLKAQPKNMEFNENSIICGVDAGSIEAIKNNIKLDYAIGDFDSLNDGEFDLLKNINVIKLNPHKDDTDTLAAIKYFKDKVDEIIIYGGIKGKRIDHLYANINLVLKYQNITIIDDETLITNLKSMSLVKDKYYYVSFFAKKDSVLSLKGFKYNLDNYVFNDYDNLCISNEIVDDALITFHGNGVMILSKYDN